MRNLKQKENISNITKEYWKNQKNVIESIQIYNKQKTIIMLKENQDIFFGKAGNRKCIKYDPVLYKSIMEYSKCLETYHYKINFSGRIKFLTEFNGELEKLRCVKCKKNYIKYDNPTQKFNFMLDKYKFCVKCRPSSASKLFFIYKHGKNWNDIWTKHRKNLSKKCNLGKKGFIYRNGKNKGIEKYNEYWDDIWKSRNNRFYSKISQQLFWMIYDEFEDKKNMFFAELNGEWFERIYDDKIKQTVYFVDFKYKDKIIEYDCGYWHNKDKDKIRDLYLKKHGYTTLRINEKEFNRNKISIDVVKKCVSFLKG